MALKLPPTLQGLSDPLAEWGEDHGPVCVSVTPELTTKKEASSLLHPFHRTMERIPATADNTLDRHGTPPPSTSPGPMINIWNDGKVINVFAPSGVFKKRKAAQKYQQVVGHNSKPLPPATPPIGTAQRWMPAATESRVHRQTRARLGTSSSNMKTPPVNSNNPRPQTEMHGKKMRPSKMSKRQQSRQMQRRFASPDAVGSLGLARPFEVWPRARRLVATGRAAEALTLFERTRRLVRDKVPVNTLAQLALEMADAAFKAAHEGNCSEATRAVFYKQAEREASAAIIHFDEGSATPHTDQIQHRASQMKGYSFLLRAGAALGNPSLDQLMQNAASLLVDKRNYERKEQLAGHQTLVKGLVSVLYDQGRHDEALQWKNFSQEVMSQTRVNTPERINSFNQFTETTSTIVQF